MQVWLIKPSADTRDGMDILRSRIGLLSQVQVMDPQADIYAQFQASHQGCNVVITDECQFFTPQQIDQLRAIVDDFAVPVICYGLRTDFMCNLFPGSRRLMEVADSFQEIKTVCDCGVKATVNARIDENGFVVTEGAQVVLGGNDRYIAMCHRCWRNAIRDHKKIKLHGQK